jgi:hypothetical protein
VIDDACFKGRLRPDDRGIYPAIDGEWYYFLDISLFFKEHPFREPGNPRVLACHDRKNSHITVAGKRSGDRMFPATTTYNEYFHIHHIRLLLKNVYPFSSSLTRTSARRDAPFSASAS